MQELIESGAALLREGQPGAALARFEAVLAGHPDLAPVHDQAGLALREMGRHEEAAQRFRRAVDLQPDSVAAINHEGIALLELQRFEDAEDCFKLALAHDAQLADTWVHLAMACWNQRRTEDAITHFQRALELDPGLVDVRGFLGGLLHTAGRLEEALECYLVALETQPGSPELQLNCGNTLLKLERADEAAARFELALGLRPQFPEAWFQLGNARRAQRRGEEAIECYERAIALRADYAEAYTNLGGTLRERGVLDRALACYHRAHDLDPDSAEANHNLGVTCHNLGQPNDAIAWYERAQRAQPGHRESQLNLAIALLQTGDLARGWEAFECRFQQTGSQSVAQLRPFRIPRWRGEPLAGRRLLVWGEQGIGDEILFSALYQEIVEMAGDCVVECAPKLVPLFARSFPRARIVPRAQPPGPATLEGLDFQCPAGSLARWLRRDIAAFPARAGHLAADSVRAAAWRARLAGCGDGLKVGFSWRSSNVEGERALACTRLDQWQAVFATPGVRFVCLQYDECSAELDDARCRFDAAIHAFPEVDLYNDLDEAAALTAALDLVISAPTSVSLLAAALGVPTWQMSYGADWQVHGTDRNPWFPAMTQFKCAWNQGWEEILGRIAARLRQLAERG